MDEYNLVSVLVELINKPELVEDLKKLEDIKDNYLVHVISEMWLLKDKLKKRMVDLNVMRSRYDYQKKQSKKLLGLLYKIYLMTKKPYKSSYMDVILQIKAFLRKLHFKDIDRC